jgi:hypothetical protein
MTEVPKIVHDRLRATELAHAASGPSHPDADLLTAFAEQALLPAQRDGVLQHLAACGDCRELVALALPPEAIAITPGTAQPESVQMPLQTKSEKNRLTTFAWPTLRWAALAAGVVVASSVLLLRSNKQAVVVVSSSYPTSAAPSPTVPIQKTQPLNQVSTSTRTDVAKVVPESSSPKNLKADQAAPSPTQTDSGMLMADAKIAGAKKDSFRTDKLSAAGAQALDSPAPRSVTESVEVSDASIATEPAPSAAANLMARDEAPAIEKAKPASPEIVGAQPVAMQQSGANKQMETSAARASGAAPSAAVNYGYVLKKETLAKQAFAPSFKLKIAAGFLQRSVDDGLNWQIGLRSDHPLLCYVILDWDVWAGGQAGTLFHSTDGGVTWVTVQPTVKTQSLSTDIVHIKVQATQVLVSTSNNETWTTADNGKTWEKK